VVIKITEVDEEDLRLRKAELETELAAIDAKIAYLELMKKPYEAVATGYSGRYSTFWKTEEAARKKLAEYYGKTYFKNGLLYGVILIQHNADGSETELERKPKVSYWK
jgi:hypothetical protein